MPEFASEIVPAFAVEFALEFATEFAFEFAFGFPLGFVSEFLLNSYSYREGFYAGIILYGCILMVCHDGMS